MLFHVYGVKPESEILEKLGEMKLGAWFNIPAGTKIIHIEKINDEEPPKELQA